MQITKLGLYKTRGYGQALITSLGTALSSGKVYGKTDRFMFTWWHQDNGAHNTFRDDDLVELIKESK